MCLAPGPALSSCFCRPRLDSAVPVVTNENMLDLFGKAFEKDFAFFKQVEVGDVSDLSELAACTQRLDVRTRVVGSHVQLCCCSV